VRPLAGRARRLVWTLALAWGALPADALAQGAGGGALLQTYTFGDAQTAGVDRIRLLTLPWGASVGLGSFAAIAVDGAWASGEATSAAGQTAALSGLTDTNVAATLGPGPDWLVVTLDASLATGTSALTLEESLVAGIVAADLLPFAVGTWGSGGNVGGSMAAAAQLGAWGVGLAAGYHVAREFEPLSSLSLAYRPGNQLQLRLAADRDVGASTLSAVVGYQRFSDDEISGANLFRSGNRVQGVVSVAFPVGLRSSALVRAGVQHRSMGTLLLDESLLAGATDSPSQQLFTLGGDLRLPLGRRAALLPTTELRVFRASDGASQGWLASAATTLDLRLAGNSTRTRIVLSPMAGLRMGRVIVAEGAETGIFGWEAGVVLRLEGGR
jgi:hypothetical protein